MRNIIIFLSALIPYVSRALAQDPGEPDSIIVSSVRIDSGATFVFVPIYAVTDDSVDYYNLPLRWNAPLGGVCPGQGTSYYYPLTTWDVLYDTILASDGYIRQIGWDCGNLDSIRIVPLYTNGGRLHTWTLRFIIDSGARPQVVVIDSCTDRSNGPIQLGYLNIPDPYIPVFVPGSITIGQPVGVDEHDSGLPQEFSLFQNYPNPFNPETRIEFSLAAPGQATLVIYDILGREVRGLLDRTLEAGYHAVTWDGRDNYGNIVPSGVYFYRLSTSGSSLSKRMTLVR